ncbi:MAG TPA: LamG domain-containing protein [Sphingomicrobium sp.]|nr:LamG domain-containing protein [Sphingomicrobium sp.]
MSRRTAIKLQVALAALLGSTPALAADPVPVATWNMDNDFGSTMEDYSGNGNNGTLYNVVTSGGGYIFDGSSSMVIVPASPSLIPGTQDFSYTVQFQTDRVPASGMDYDLIRKGQDGTPGGGFKVELIRSNGKAVAFCRINDSRGKSAALTDKTNLADNKLHTIKCARTGKTMTLKVDSKSSLKKRDISIQSISNNSDVTIGAKLPDGEGPQNDWYIGVIRSAGISIAPAE